MPMKRPEYIRQGETFTVNTTYPQDLESSGYLSALLLQVTGTPVNGATLAAEPWRLIDHLGKIEVLGNGSDPIISCDWKHMFYLNFLDQQKCLPTWWRNYATITQREFILIPFGRYLWDTEYGLDLSKWRSKCKLRITNTATATYYTGNLSLNIMALYMDDLPNGFPKGFLSKTEFHKWTTASDAWEYNDLPTQYPFRGVHLQCVPDVDANFVAESSIQNLCYDTLFATNARKNKLVTGQMFERMVLQYMEQPGIPLTSIQPDRTADYGLDTGIGYITGLAGIAGSGDGAAAAVIPTEGTGLNLPTIKLETREADNTPDILVTGMAVQDFFTFHYTREADPSWLLDFNRHGQISLDVKTRSGAAYADGTNTIVLDQVRPHPVAA